MITHAMNIHDDVRGQSLDKLAFEKGDHRRDDRSEARSAKAKARPASQVFVFFFTFIFVSSGWAGDSANDAVWRVWLESKAMRAPVSAPLSGAARTELAAGFLHGQELTWLGKADFAAMHLEWKQFAAKARVNSSADLRALTPRYARDRKQVIQYAELTSGAPVVASAVLAADFLARFRETLGEKVLLVVPNRFTAYVFPALASNYADYAPMVFEAFRSSAYPVSVELFEVSAEGMRAVGVYEEP